VNYGDAIQNRLVTLAMAFSFPVYSHQPAAVGAKRCTVEGSCAKPSTVLAWQESTIFGEAVNHRRTSDRREVIGWTWRLDVRFNGVVSLEEFEKSLCDHLPRIPRSATLDRQIDLLLEDAEYQTPVTQQPAQGTRVLYRFTAQFTPT